MNVKKVRRIYNELGLQLRNKSPKRKVKAKLSRDRREAVSPLEVWAMDFVHSQLELPFSDRRHAERKTLHSASGGSFAPMSTSKPKGYDCR